MRGVRRDLTTDFARLRTSCNERHRERAGPRLGWLLTILKEGDAQALARFVEAGRATQRSQPSQACGWCNARVAARPDAAASAAGVKVAKACQLCLGWHCADCCAFWLRFAASEAPKRGSRPPELECCEACRRLFDVLLWQKEQPPAGLAASSSQLLAMHAELSGALTSLAAALAQLEGLSRIAELTQSVDHSVEDREEEELARAECRKATADCCGAAAGAQAAAEGIIRKLAEVQCPAAQGPRAGDARLREALVRHGRLALEGLRPRLRAAELRLASGAAGASAGQRTLSG